MELERNYDTADALEVGRQDLREAVRFLKALADVINSALGDYINNVIARNTP